VSRTAVAIEPKPTRAASPRLVADAVGLAERMPDIMVAARRIAASVSHGLHGRKRAGPGEDFWQYRRFQQGEASNLVDWRRSARDDHLYVREKEWESAHTIWLWTDLSPSMAVRSDLANQSKRDRAVLLTLALSELLVRAGERVGLLGLTRPTASRFVLDRFAEALIAAPPAAEGSLPPRISVARFSEVVLLGDLLDPVEELDSRFETIASAGARLHLTQVLDPVEETFPFDGRVEFVEPETGRSFIAGRAEGYREAYIARLTAHRTSLIDATRRRGDGFVLHRTDRPAVEPLLALTQRFAHAGDVMGAR
jgi:uncharacterized protein (DUF58 family)